MQHLVTKTAVIWAIAMGICTSASAAETGKFPSLCKPGEVAFLNAKMGKVVHAGGHISWDKNGKLLSLCADKEHEPLGKLTYRYGSPDHVDMERVATPAEPFNIYSTDTGPHTGDNMIFFSNGPYTYYISDGLGMANGVSLAVVKNGKRILNQFSGTDSETDFDSDLININFDSASSPIFQHKKPKDSLYIIMNESGQ